MWNGMYNGKGGPWPNETDPTKNITMNASACDNFWEMTDTVKTKCNSTTPYYLPTNMTCHADVLSGFYSELNVLSPCDPSCSSCTGSTKELCSSDETNWLLYGGIGLVVVVVIIVIIFFVAKSASGNGDDDSDDESEDYGK